MHAAYFNAIFSLLHLLTGVEVCSRATALVWRSENNLLSRESVLPFDHRQAPLPAAPCPSASTYFDPEKSASRRGDVTCPRSHSRPSRFWPPAARQRWKRDGASRAWPVRQAGTGSRPKAGSPSPPSPHSPLGKLRSAGASQPSL